MALQSVEQERAKSALQWAEQWGEKGVDKDLLAVANGMPAMILMNGLGQTAAFYKSKGGKHVELYKLLSTWLEQPGKPYAGKELLSGITNEDANTYRAAQAEALAYLQWVKKFAKAYYKGV
jgi:CRISPR-associated protein Cmr5